MTGMAMFLGALLFQVQKGEGIEALLRNLDSDRIEDRASAELLLVKKGEAAIPELEAILKDSPSEEVRARGSRILGIIRKSISWVNNPAGNVVGGFRARLVASGKSYDYGRKILFRLEIRNVSNKPRSLVIPGELDTHFPNGSFSSDTAHGVIVLKRIPKRKPGLINSGAG